MFNLTGIIKGILLQDPTDRSKQLAITISPSATTGTSTTLVAAQTANRTITLPDGNATLSTADSIETLSNKTFADPLLLEQSTTPSNPPASENKLYFKSDNHIYSLDSSGVERQVDAAFSNPMTSKGDMIVGDTGGTETRLPGGTTGQILTYDTTAPQNVKWATLSIANNRSTSAVINSSTTSTSYSTPTNGSVTITPTGRDVMITLIPNTTGGNANLAADASGGSEEFVSVSFQILKDGVSIGAVQLAADVGDSTGNTALNIPPSCLMVIDPAPTSVSHTYSVQYKANTATTLVAISNCLLVAKEF